jgi:hypothetical protein
MLICSPCLGQMRTWLQQIPAAMTVLRDGSMQRERTGTTGRTGTKTAPLPGRLDTLNLIGPASNTEVRGEDQEYTRPIIGVLGDWTRVVCLERHLNGPAQWTEPCLAAWLLPHLGWVSTQVWADEIHRELNDMTWAIRGIVRIDIRTRPVSRPCPRCQSLLLTQTDGDQYTRCGGCLSAFTQAELNDDAARRAAA